MACFWMYQQETAITVPVAEEVDSVTQYKVSVKINNVKWTVSHRYNDFYELHNQLIVDHGVSKDLLPPKKLIGNKDPLFIEIRRKGLEKYLQEILCYLKRTMPKLFTDFLNFHLYDVYCLMQNLAFQICNESEAVLASSTYSFNPLQLYAISESLKNPFPGFERVDNKYDICHILDFCSKLNELNIIGIETNYIESNIIPNDLPFDFAAFKALNIVKIVDLGMEKVYSAEAIRKTVQKLHANKCSITVIAQVLQCDILHKSSLENTQIWSKLTHVDLSGNNITDIDETMKLVPLLTKLTLNQNKISAISDLSYLKFLTHLYLANNLITTCDKLHTKLVNIVFLDLSQNNITALQGFEDLYKLETLDVSFNQIANIEDVSHISVVPCLQHLILTGNAVATTVDYRIKVLEYFGESAKTVWLDNEKTSQAELDKVQLLCALRIVKEGKIPNLHSPMSYK